MLKTCSQCQAEFEITDEDLSFYDKISPTFANTKFPIPPPHDCPKCRRQQRMLFRNERKQYRRTSAISGKEILTTFAPDSPYKTCTQEEWIGGNWDAIDEGRDFDPSRPFFDQLKELNLAVPHQGLNNMNVENSEFTNYGLNLKNCYLLFGASNDEDCLHGKFILTCKNVIDCLSLHSCEWCYEGISSRQCYGCSYFLNCNNCSDCLFVEDCTACKNCIGCFGLRNKEYCILNEQLSSEEYEKRKAEITPLSIKKIQKMQSDLQELQKKLPHIASHMYASENCTGDMIFNSSDCDTCFDIHNCEKCKYVSFAPNGVGSYDCTFAAPEGVEWCNHVIATLGHRLMGTYLCWYSHDVYYSINCRTCDFCFGCVGLQSKKYCILNKQYTKEEYEELASNIVQQMVEAGEWGQFLPARLSQFAYNETIANEFFPLTKEKAEANGWTWKNEKDAPLDVEKKIAAATLPDTIGEVPDDIIHWAIICEATLRPFRITKQELTFYRDFQIPIPRLHPDERHRIRMEKKDTYMLCQRNCTKCNKAIQTSYSPDRPEIVYCEECYLKEVY
jgi:hypothetical protein